MSRLFKMKAWLTIPETAKHLSGLFGEVVSESDVLQLGIEGRLKISIRFVNYTKAFPGEIVSAEQAKLTLMPEKILSVFEEMETIRLGIPVTIDRPVADVVGYRLNNQQVFEKDGNTKYIAGIYDLSMIGDEARGIEKRYQSKIDGINVRMPFDAKLVIQSPSGEKLILMAESDDEWEPCADPIPSDATLVVRTEALLEFERNSVGEPITTSHAHVSDKLAKMNQASTRFWGNADRDDRGTHPDNATVAAWLTKQGFSSTLADKAATLIRPEWAPTGRKPEE